MQTKVGMIVAIGFKGQDAILDVFSEYSDRDSEMAAGMIFNADDTMGFFPVFDEDPGAGVYECTADVFVSDCEDDNLFEVSNLKITRSLDAQYIRNHLVALYHK